jgi:hypothetical protein
MKRVKGKMRNVKKEEEKDVELKKGKGGRYVMKK